jgi:hypothetical protein
VPLPSAAAADDVLHRAEQIGFGRRDIASLFQVLARHRLLHGHAPLNDRFVRDIIDTVLTAIG